MEFQLEECVENALRKPIHSAAAELVRRALEAAEQGIQFREVSSCGRIVAHLLYDTYGTPKTIRLGDSAPVDTKHDEPDWKLNFLLTPKV